MSRGVRKARHRETETMVGRRTKAQFFEIALVGFDEACRVGVLGQKEAYAEGEPQAAIDVFLIKKQ